LPKKIHPVPVALLLVAAATIAGQAIGASGATALAMVYLLAVVATSYFLGYFAALAAAVGSFLALNYFFMAPRYSVDVASADSWAALGGFLAVSVVVASLVRRLQDQKARLEGSRQQADYARELAERLSGLQEEEAVLEAACGLIHRALGLPVGIAVPDARGERFTLAHPHPANGVQFDPRAAKWVCQNAKTIGPGTGNWPEGGVWVMPFGRLPGVYPVLVAVKGIAPAAEGELTFLRGLLDQAATAYQRVRNERRAREAESLAREESIQNALLSSVSHDMRTPLTSILGCATTLLRQRAALPDEEQAKLLESIAAEVRHLAAATENILALTRLESIGSRGLALDWQSPEEIVGAVLRRYHARELPHELRSRVPGGLPLIKADAVLLSQALGNLIDNALAAHRGAEPIWVGAERQGGGVALYVEDRGRGFGADFRVEDIRKFQRTDRRGKGMGLGLAIVQTIAHLHHGKLQIAQREGEGARVALLCPALAEEPALE
jgi:two-component system sensor histidine kinase KdpD